MNRQLKRVQKTMKSSFLRTMALLLLGLAVGTGMACGQKPSQETTEVQAGEKGKILYYRNPMNPKITSPTPKKDEMGMDYVPVYENEVKQP